MTTARQKLWAAAAERAAAADGQELAAGLFALLALPSDAERAGHSCREHAVGFRTVEGRRGFRCGICGEVVRWVDEAIV